VLQGDVRLFLEDPHNVTIVFVAVVSDPMACTGTVTVAVE
jgi:hypothetical protein